jgi:CRP/FNR family transcriptional regulator, cyclic AMP receptor protein
MVGTTRSRVSMFMNKFRKLGFIEYNGSLEVHNSLLNVVLHDNPHLRKRAEKEKMNLVNLVSCDRPVLPRA